MKKITKATFRGAFIVLAGLACLLFQVVFFAVSPLLIIIGYGFELYAWSNSADYKIQHSEPFLVLLIPTNELFIKPIFKKRGF